MLSFCFQTNQQARSEYVGQESFLYRKCFLFNAKHLLEFGSVTSEEIKTERQPLLRYFRQKPIVEPCVFCSNDSAISSFPTGVPVCLAWSWRPGDLRNFQR